MQLGACVQRAVGGSLMQPRAAASSHGAAQAQGHPGLSRSAALRHATGLCGMVCMTCVRVGWSGQTGARGGILLNGARAGWFHGQMYRPVGADVGVEQLPFRSL